jgi:hypothetical protein
MPGREGHNLEVELENILVREVVLNSPAILYRAPDNFKNNPEM